MSSKYKLLWLSGLLQGRELCLPLGGISIGPDGDVLATLVEMKQLELTVDEEGVHLNSQVSAWVDGKHVRSLTLLPTGKVIEIAGIAIVLGELEDELEMRVLPKHSSFKAKNSFWILLITSVLTLVLLMSVILSPALPQEPVLTPNQWVSQQLVQSELNDVKVSWSSSGVVTLSGYCRDTQQIASFINDLKNKDILFIDHILCGDQLVRNVKGILAQNGFPDAVVALGEGLGSVKISGAIRSGVAWDKAVDAFNNLSGLNGWQVSNQINSQLKPLIKQLREKQLLKGLMVEQVKNTIVITGKISEARQQQVMKVTKDLSQHYGSGFKFIFQNIPVRDELSQMLSSPVVSYGGNAESSFIELGNGMRLSAGSKLDNGYVINYINVNGLDLSRGGELVHIPLIF